MSEERDISTAVRGDIFLIDNMRCLVLDASGDTLKTLMVLMQNYSGTGYKIMEYSRRVPHKMQHVGHIVINMNIESMAARAGFSC